MALELRPPGSKLPLALGALTVLALGFLTGRFALYLQKDAFLAPRASQPIGIANPSPGLAPHLSTEIASSGLPNENPASPEGSPSEKSERIRQIEEGLKNLQSNDSEFLKSLATEIQAARARISELRSFLSTTERSLLEQSKRSSSNEQSLRWLQYQQEIFVLGQELADAKSAVADQERLLQLFWGSDEGTSIMREMRGELARRQAKLRSIEVEIQNYNDGQESSLFAENERENAELLAWRARRAQLEAAYAEAVEALNSANLSYQEVAQASAERRRHVEQLSREKAALESAGEL